MDLIKSHLAVSEELIDKEQLRKDLESLDPVNAEDIIKKLKNERIVENSDSA